MDCFENMRRCDITMYGNNEQRGNKHAGSDNWSVVRLSKDAETSKASPREATSFMKR